MKNLIYSIIMLLLFMLPSCGSEGEEFAQEKQGEVESTISEDLENEKAGEAEPELDLEEYFSSLEGIERFFVKQDKGRLYSLLKFHDREEDQELIAQMSNSNDVHRVNIIELDKKSGYIRFYKPGTECKTTMVYWNQSNGKQLIGSLLSCCTMFCDADLSFELFNGNEYEIIKSESIIPELDGLKKMRPEGHLEGDGYDTNIELPKTGKNILYCVEGDCVELKWDDGLFLITKNDGEDQKTVNVEEAVNVPALTDPREDPDYIGTPCEYVNGECIRHDHKK